MNIEEARKARGMSRKDVSRKLGIPYRSLENWEKGLSKCPDYVEELKRGTVVFEGEDFERHFDDYMEEWGVDEEEQEKYRKMLEEKIAIPDWGIVEDNGNTYYIMHCL